jgi:hypothetical protein
MNANSIIEKTIDFYRGLAGYQDCGYSSVIVYDAQERELSHSATFQTNHSIQKGLSLSWYAGQETTLSRVADTIEIGVDGASQIKVNQKVRKKCTALQAMRIAGGGGNLGFVVLPVLMIEAVKHFKSFGLNSVSLSKLDGEAIVDDVECSIVKVVLSEMPWFGTYYIGKSDFIIRKFERERTIDIPKDMRSKFADDFFSEYPELRTEKLWFKDIKFARAS